MSLEATGQRGTKEMANTVGAAEHVPESPEYSESRLSKTEWVQNFKGKVNGAEVNLMRRTHWIEDHEESIYQLFVNGEKIDLNTDKNYDFYWAKDVLRRAQEIDTTRGEA